jgi:hypothetical protein
MALYFDTSAINWVHDNDAELPGDLRSLGKTTQISVYNVLEMVATKKQRRRWSLLQTSYALSQDYRPLVEVKDILTQTLRAYLDGVEKIGVSVPPTNPLWRCLVRPADVGEKQRLAALSELKRFEEGFRSMHRGGRPHVQALRDLDQIRERFANAAVFLNAYLADANFLNSFLDGWFIDRRCPEARGRALEVISQVAEWRACLAAQLHAIYEQGLQAQNFGSRKTAGCLDLLQITYLPVFEFFVTTDPALLRIAEDVASRCRPSEAITPSDLRSKLGI